MSTFRFLAKLNSGRTYRRFVSDTRTPELAQRRVWNEILGEISGAPFWQGKLTSSSELRDFPITEYEDYRSAIDRSFQTGISELSGKPVMYWSESSGTSGKRKVFPITPKYREQFQRTTPPYLHGLIEKFPGFLNQKVLYFAGMNPSEISPSGIDVGFISNFNYRHIPRMLQKGYGFPKEVFQSWPVFEKWAPVYALATDLSAMIAITPSVLTQFAERIEKNAELYRDILSGKVALPSELPALSVSKKRLELVQAVLSSKKISFRALWPSLQFVSCWKGSGCALQLPQLARFSDLPVVDATYSATEGWVNVPLPGGVGGPVHPGAHIFEFAKAGEEPSPEKLLPLWKLEKGESYEIFLSTAMGMIRYRLFDIVKCTGHFERSPIIEFVQKSLNEIILGMIRVSESQILEALQSVDMGPGTRWFIAPNQTGDRLVFFTSSSDRPTASDLASADQRLGELNKYYARDISRGLLKPMEITRLPLSHPVWQVSTHQQSKPQPVRRQAPELESASNPR
jgi:hypothetical protein